MKCISYVLPNHRYYPTMIPGIMTWKSRL